MIKVLGQMRNLRRGHDSQGQLKKIEVDQSYEGYSSFMAPQRMEQILRDVMNERQRETKPTDTAEMTDRKRQAEDMQIDRRVLKPRTDTYLTPEWDEMIPFPTSTYHRPPTKFMFLPLSANLFHQQLGKSASTATVKVNMTSPPSTKANTPPNLSTPHKVQATSAAPLLTPYVSAMRLERSANVRRYQPRPQRRSRNRPITRTAMCMRMYMISFTHTCIMSTF